MNPSPPNPSPAVAQALTEDVGSGDLTAALIPEQTQAQARVISRQPCRVVRKRLV